MATGLEDRAKTFSLAAAWNGTGTEPANTTATLNMPGEGTVAFQLSGTFTATVTFEVSVDGTNYIVVNATNGLFSSGAVASTATTAGIFLVHFPAAQYVRARCSAFTSGPIAITARASTAPFARGSTSASAGSAVSIADGQDTAQGSTTDAGIITDSNGTVIGFLRGAIKMWINYLARIPAALTGSGNFKVSIAESTATVTADTELPAAAALADATANPTTPLVGTALEGFNATTWDRLRTYLGAQGNAVATSPVLAIASMLNDASTNWVVQRTASAVVDAVAGGTIAPAAMWGFNSATFDRVRTAPGATGTTGTGLLGSGPCLWDSVGATNFVKQAGDASGRAIVVGSTTPADALTNPTTTVNTGAFLNAWDSVNSQWNRAISTTSDGSTAPTKGSLLVGIGLFNGTNQLTVLRNASNDGSSASVLLPAQLYAWNGASGDRVRNNVDVTLLASGARSVTQTSADITTYNCGAIQVTYDNTVTAGYSDVVTIDGKDPASGKYYNLLTSAAITTATVTNTYTVDPAVPAVANVSAQKRLPRVIRIVVTAGNGTSHTYSVGYTLQPC